MAIQSKNLYIDNEDMQYHIANTIDWDTIILLKENDFSDFKEYEKTGDENLAWAISSVENGIDQYKSILEGLGEISAKELLKNARAIDEKGFGFENGKVLFPEEMNENIRHLTENGYMGLLLPRKYGGMQIPNVANVMAAELVSTGDIGMGVLLACQDLGDIIYKFGSEEQHEKYLPRLSSGEIGAAMLLTEPNHGSDLQSAQTKGESNGDGKVKVNGVKMWISHGTPHTPDGSVYLTVTRTVKKSDGNFKSGGGGLSLVLVESKDAEIVSLEHKMGIHSSPTVQIALDNSPGEIVGKEGYGLIEYTMTLMNAARLTIAAQSIGASEIAFREAWSYANVREQFGVLIKEIPAVKQMLEEMEISLHASRALVYQTAQVVDIMEGLEHKLKHDGLNEKEIKKNEDYVKWSKLAKVLTPFSKFYAAEEANRNAYKAIQVHGGVGFSEEYDVARIYRDSRILSIYEGTSQLQVVAAIVGVLEAYGRENTHLLNYQEELLSGIDVDAELESFRALIKKSQGLMRKLVPEYKKLDQEFRGRYAHDIVWAATMIFISILYLRMVAFNGGEKKKYEAKKYINEMWIFCRSVEERINLQSAL